MKKLMIVTPNYVGEDRRGRGVIPVAMPMASEVSSNGNGNGKEEKDVLTFIGESLFSALGGI